MFHVKGKKEGRRGKGESGEWYNVLSCLDVFVYLVVGTCMRWNELN